MCTDINTLLAILDVTFLRLNNQSAQWKFESEILTRSLVPFVLEKKLKYGFFSKTVLYDVEVILIQGSAQHSWFAAERLKVHIFEFFYAASNM